MRYVGYEAPCIWLSLLAGFWLNVCGTGNLGCAQLGQFHESILSHAFFSTRLPVTIPFLYESTTMLTPTTGKVYPSEVIRRVLCSF